MPCLVHRNLIYACTYDQLTPPNGFLIYACTYDQLTPPNGFRLDVALEEGPFESLSSRFQTRGHWVLCRLVDVFYVGSSIPPQWKSTNSSSSTSWYLPSSSCFYLNKHTSSLRSGRRVPSQQRHGCYCQYYQLRLSTWLMIRLN